MKNAIQKTAQQNELPFPSDQVNQEKLNLEIQKLKEEITHLRSRWYLPALIQATPAALVVLATVAVAWSTGLLDAKRENLSAQNERLQTQSMLLQQEEKEIRAKMTSLNDELQIAQVELNAYKAEEKAINIVRKLWISSTVEYLPDDRGFRIQIDGGSTRFTVTIVDSSGIPHETVDDRPQRISETLEALTGMKSFTDLTISNVPLTARNLEQIGRIEKLKSLRLVRNDLSDETMKHFPAMAKLESLSFFHQLFKDASTLRYCTKLTTLVFHETPIHGNEFRELLALQSIERIGLQTTAITDQEVPLLLGFPKLYSLSITGTAITESGMQQLASHQPLRYLFISDREDMERLRLDIRKINDRLLIVDLTNSESFGEYFHFRE